MGLLLVFNYISLYIYMYMYVCTVDDQIVEFKMSFCFY